jgi:hypothetical protein
VKLHKGIAYFTERESARVICAEIIGRKAHPLDIGTQYPQARVVEYDRGFAVQYRLSGPYYPELETENSAG